MSRLAGIERARQAARELTSAQEARVSNELRSQARQFNQKIHGLEVASDKWSRHNQVRQNHARENIQCFREELDAQSRTTEHYLQQTNSFHDSEHTRLASVEDGRHQESFSRLSEMRSQTQMRAGFLRVEILSEERVRMESDEKARLQQEREDAFTYEKQAQEDTAKRDAEELAFRKQEYEDRLADERLEQELEAQRVTDEKLWLAEEQHRKVVGQQRSIAFSKQPAKRSGSHALHHERMAGAVHSSNSLAPQFPVSGDSRDERPPTGFVSAQQAPTPLAVPWL